MSELLQWHHLACQPHVQETAHGIREQLQMPRFVALTVASDERDLTWAVEGFASLARRAGYDIEPAVLIVSRSTTPEGDPLSALIEAVNARIDPVARVVLADEHQPAERCAQYRAANVLLVPSLEPGAQRVVKQYVVSRIAGFGAVVARSEAAEALVGPKASQNGLYTCGPDPEDLARSLLRAALAAPQECRNRMRVLRHELCHGIGDLTAGATESP